MAGFDPLSAGLGIGTGLLGGVLNLFGASKQAKAAEAAAKAQQEAAARAGKGVIDTADAHNQDIISSADRASGAVSDAAARAGADATAAAGRSNALLEPYRFAGNNANDLLDQGLADGGRFNRTPTMADIQIDPGFDFRLGQGQKTLERSAAARGGAASGTALMDLTRFSQGLASDEYAKAFQRFRDSTGDAFSRLNTVAGRGMDAAGEEGKNTINAAQYSGDKTVGAATYGGDKIFDASRITADNANTAAARNGEYITQGGNAQAAGIVGKANADSSKLTGFFNGAMGGANVYNMLSNPGTSKKVGYTS